MKQTNTIQKLIQAKREADAAVRALNAQDKQALEIKLDVEHAYYSSALEGSKLDRKTFDELAKKA
jgi:hypothetical protein